MSICTYIAQEELDKFHQNISDKDILEWFNQVIQAANGTIPFYIEESALPCKREGLFGKFRKAKMKIMYSIYYQILHGEVQIVNLCPRQEDESSICTLLSKDQAINYMIAWLHGKQTVAK